MLIVVTGDAGIGKSTVCRKVIDIQWSRGEVCGGILCHSSPGKSIIVEDFASGKQMLLASSVNIFNSPRVGEYYFNREGFNFGQKAIERGIASSLLVIDQIGELELRGDGFSNAINVINSRKTKNKLVVICKDLVSSFLPLLNESPIILEAMHNTRNELPAKIAEILTPAITMPLVRLLLESCSKPSVISI